MKEDIDFYAAHAIEQEGLPPNWQAFKYECFPKRGLKTLYFEITGAVCDAVITQGKRNGQPNWRKLDKATQRTVVLTVADHAAWLLNWELKNSKCHNCQGACQEVASFGIHGTTYRPCSRCKGTGKPPVKTEEVVA